MQGWHTRNARTPVRNSPQRSALLSRPIPFSFVAVVLASPSSMAEDRACSGVAELEQDFAAALGFQ